MKKPLFLIPLTLFAILLSVEPSQAATKEYVVKKGDALSQISLRFLGTTNTKELQRLNNIRDPSKIYEGQVIKIPVYKKKIIVRKKLGIRLIPYKVGKNETMKIIAQRFYGSTNPAWLRKLNRLKEDEEVEEGDEVLLPVKIEKVKYKISGRDRKKAEELGVTIW